MAANINTTIITTIINMDDINELSSETFAICVINGCSVVEIIESVFADNESNADDNSRFSDVIELLDKPGCKRTELDVKEGIKMRVPVVFDEAAALLVGCKV